MKKISSQVGPVRFVLLVLLSFISANCFSNDELVPENTLLSDFPFGTRMVVKKEMTRISAAGRNVVSFDGRTVYEDIIGSSHSCYSDEVNCFNKASFPWLSLTGNLVLHVGDVFSVVYKVPESTMEHFYLIGHVFRSGIMTNDSLSIHFPTDTKNAEPKTIGDFNKLTNYTFQFVYDDPMKFELYPGMDKEVAMEVEVKKITDHLKAQQYEQALSRFFRVSKALHADNLKMDELLAYYYVSTADKAGDKAFASGLATWYLRDYGKKGGHYKEVVEILSRQ